MVEYDVLWNKITLVFPILHNQSLDETCAEMDYREAVEVIKTLKLPRHIENLVFNKLEKTMRQNIVPTFWSYFTDNKNELSHFTQFQRAVEELYYSLSVYIPLMNKLEKVLSDCSTTCTMYGEASVLSAFKLLVRSTLLAQLPPDHKKTVENFYEIAFKAFCNLDEAGNEDVPCGGCQQDGQQCHCPKICSVFYETNKRLVELDLLEPLVGQVLSSLIHIRIENHITQLCKNSFDVSYMAVLEKWLNTVVMIWLNRIYCVDADDKLDDSMTKFQQKLTYFLNETYTRTRINQLFNIIIEYPDSLPAVEDLHACLPKTDLRPLLISKLQRALATRLLHPGVSTPDILTAYVAAIRSLRVLDPSGALLDTVTQPIHQYLRSREDTVRSVVGSLTEEGLSDLADELVKGEALHLDENAPEEEDDATDWETWTPDPVDVEPSKQRKSRRTSDIISMLVNVYGSKELFVNEYRTLLADRLLSQLSCNAEKEIRYLELLKLRFGETQLHYCEVMLKDICDSKRINTHLQNDAEYKAESGDFPVAALVLSAQFWPAFKDETLELPALIKEQFQFYTNGFETLKGNRTLCWKPHLGTVEVEIELKDRTLGLTVSPLLATIIMHFQNREQWSVDELSQEMKVPATLLRKKISFWQSQGILRELSPDMFVVIEETSNATKDKGPSTADIICEDDESESAMASSQDQREEELQVFWSYIIGMLTNLDSMPLERIHQMLKMFASQGPTAIECGLQELRQFLDRKVREHKLLYTGGLYRLPKT
ncbi:morula [Carabus blaptoides fortunei]